MARKKRGIPLEDNMRAKIAEQLPDAIDCALRSYRDFYAQETGGDAKAFSAHHTACKTAIAHIELLLKLAAWVHLPREDADSDAGLAVLLRSAQEELERYNGGQDDDE